jgi:hypothetical protein
MKSTEHAFQLRQRHDEIETSRKFSSQKATVYSMRIYNMTRVNTPRSEVGDGVGHGPHECRVAALALLAYFYLRVSVLGFY